ncbi:taste receptor type 2 member 4-like [Anomaloglossus baeobatrachus]|uniref:taste receptor type 2 member 4-like n=1 Tax=Anomaloglossus baeobatrachus TaxID=238106 RepID=UPI003F4F85B4
MASSLEDSVHYQRIAAAGFVLLTGIMTQLYIVVVNITEWMKGIPKNPVDQIVTSLGITRIFLHCFSFLNTMCDIFLEKYLEFMQIFVYMIANSSNFADIWLGTLFSVIFCMKISNLHNVFFLYLKTLIFRRVVHLVMALVLSSIGFMSLYLVTDHFLTSNFWLRDFPSNETQIFEIRHGIAFIAVGNIIPFLIYCTSSLLLIVSLGIHLTRMKCNSNVSTNLDSYYKAIQFMTLSLISFVLRIASNLVVLCFYNDMDFVWIFIIWNSVAIFKSIYLIYRMNKLSNRLSNILHLAANYLLDRRFSLSTCRAQEETTTAL